MPLSVQTEISPQLLNGFSLTPPDFVTVTFPLMSTLPSASMILRVLNEIFSPLSDGLPRIKHSRQHVSQQFAQLGTVWFIRLTTIRPVGPTNNIMGSCEARNTRITLYFWVRE